MNTWFKLKIFIMYIAIPIGLYDWYILFHCAGGNRGFGVTTIASVMIITFCLLNVFL